MRAIAVVGYLSAAFACYAFGTLALLEARRIAWLDTYGPCGVTLRHTTGTELTPSTLPWVTSNTIERRTFDNSGPADPVVEIRNRAK